MRPCIRFLLSVLVVLGFASNAGAVKYMSLGDAVKRFIPKGSKIVKVTHPLTPEQKKTIRSEYGWNPTEPKYSFYVGKDASGAALAYVFVVPEIFNTCFHKFAIGLEPDGDVMETVIVELSCPRAVPVNKKSFLKQFRNKKHTDPLTTQLDIDAVTGATLSSEVAAQATRKAVSLHNLFFADAKSSGATAEVRRARAAGAAKIQKAIDTGETMDPNAGHAASK